MPSDSPMPACSRRSPNTRRRRLSSPRRTGAHRGRAGTAESRAAVSEGHAARRRVDRVGRGGRRGCEARARRRRRPRAVVAPGLQAAGYVYRVVRVLHAGTPFARKGDLQMTLPKMDVPVGDVAWEVFAPESYSAADDRRQRDRDRPCYAGCGRGSQAAPARAAWLGEASGSGSVRRRWRAAERGARAARSPVPRPMEARCRSAAELPIVSGAVLPGVTVELATPALSRVRRRSPATPDGTFTISNGAAGGPACA